VNRVLEDLRAQCQAFIDGPGAGAAGHAIEYAVEARYASQVWEIEVPLAHDRFTDDTQLAALVEGFHAMHEQIFAIRDPGSIIEFVGWTATARCRLRDSESGRLTASAGRAVSGSRKVYFSGAGQVDATLYDFETMQANVEHTGPAVVESPFTTVVADADTRFLRTASGSLLMHPQGRTAR